MDTESRPASVGDLVLGSIEKRQREAERGQAIGFSHRSSRLTVFVKARFAGRFIFLTKFKRVRVGNIGPLLRWARARAGPHGLGPPLVPPFLERPPRPVP